MISEFWIANISGLFSRIDSALYKIQSSQFRIPSAISDIITGIILFFIIGCEFFLQYKIVFNKHRKENA